MVKITVVEWARAPGCRTVRPQGAWLRALTVHEARLDAPTGGRTEADEEGVVLVLSGTHDLAAGAGSWPSRGLRGSPFEGRPCALYLPPKTRWSASGGEGELAEVRVRRPPAPPPAEPDPAAVRKPLLPLAGSQKAFDPATGEWRPLESFPDSPQAIPPRAIERIERDGVLVERVLGPDFKARGLRLDECVLAAGQRFAPEPSENPGEELLCFVRPRSRATVAGGDEFFEIENDVSVTGPATITALDGACYVLVVRAGPRR